MKPGFQQFKCSARRRSFGTALAGLWWALAAISMPGCGGVGASGGPVDGAKAFEHTRAIVEFGPRPPGSAALREVSGYIQRELKSLGLETHTQDFSPLTPLGQIRMTNIWAELPGRSERVIILASHYESKYYEEFEFVGANDGASTSGLLLELARVLSLESPVDASLWFVFFDGEEALVEWSDHDSLYGSRAFVRMLQGDSSLERIGAMILLDLIGGKDLRIVRDENSTDWLNEIVWSTAERLGYAHIFRRRGSVNALDDHIPFLRAGVPAIDIIDLSYRFWHTPEDTIDKISPENLAIVGNVVVASLPEVERQMTRESGDSRR